MVSMCTRWRRTGAPLLRMCQHMHAVEVTAYGARGPQWMCPTCGAHWWNRSWE